MSSDGSRAADLLAPPDAHWAGHPRLSAVLRVVATVLPLLVSVALTFGLSRLVPPPKGLAPVFFWWAVLSAVSTAVLLVLGRLLRRLLPLAAMVGLTLVFPDRTPSRFGMALRVGTVSDLDQRVHEARMAGIEGDETAAAAGLLELVCDLNSHDHSTRGHAERVRALSQLIAEELRLPQADRDRLNWSALLHDVGKLEVAREVLNRPGELTSADRARMRSHPAAGERLVRPLRNWLGSWLDAVDQHHERWDGHGYPRGLGGEAISLSARIVAVADAFDAMTATSSYGPQLSAVDARAELVRNAGSQFDPQVVRAFLAISLGRLRLAMGPLSWLANLPVVGRVPVTPAITALLGGSVAAVALLSGGAGTVAQAFPADDVPAVVSTVAPTTAAPALTTAPRGRADEPRSTTTSTTPDAPPPDAPPPDAPPPTVPIVVDPPPPPPLPLPPPPPVDPEPPAADPPARVVAANLVRVLDEDSSVDIDLTGTGSVQVIGGPTHGRVSVPGSGIRRYRPDADFHGRDRFTYQRCLGDVCATGEVELVVRPVNDAPIAGRDRSAVREDGTVLIDVLADDRDVDGDALSVTRAFPADHGATEIAPDGRVRYTPDADEVATDTFTYRVSDGNGAHDTATVVVTIDPVNDPPSAVAGADQATTEDAGPQVVAGWATVISPGPANEATQRVTFAATATDRSLFSTQPAVSPTGALSYTPARDANGTTLVTVRASDDGGTAHGGRDTSPGQVVRITIDPVNDVPVFAVGPDQAVVADAGTQTVPGWATGINPGPADEAGQVVTFEVAAADPTLFADQPAVAGDGGLTYRPDPDADGVTTVSVRAVDDGGTADGGEDTSAVQTFTITVDPAPVGPVNHPPAFVAGVAPVVDEDSGPQRVPGWATEISPGPADEAGQVVTFDVAAADPMLFAAGPSVSSDGELTFTPAPDANGVTTLTVTAHDDGGTDNGGVDTSAPQDVSLTVTPVNDAPEFIGGADQDLTEDDPPQRVPGWATDISPGPADEAGQAVTFDAVADDPDLFSAGPTVSADGELTFTPAPDAFGVARVIVTAHDDGGTDGPGQDTSPGQVLTITLDPVAESPRAADDVLSMAEDDVDGARVDVLANDVEPDGDPLLVFSWDDSSLTHGALVHDVDGEFTYTPEPEWSGVETFDYIVTDTLGGFDTATVTITVSPVPDSPIARPDSYLTAESTLLSVPSPGVLSNDGDPDGEPITVNTTPVTPTSHGALTLRADGSFDYTPDAGFRGYDGFTYELADVTGRTDVTAVAIVVDSGLTPAGWYLGDRGSSPDAFDLVASPPSGGNPPPDVDADGHPGLTLVANGRHEPKEDETDPAKYQYWDLAPPTPVVLQGSLHIELWSTIADFDPHKTGHPYFWVYECAADGTDCTLLLADDFHITDWNGGVADWVFRDLTLGQLDTTIDPGRMLRVRMSSKHDDLWVAMSAARPSRLVLVPTGAGPLGDDSYTLPEDSPTVNLDILANDSPAVAPGTVEITTAPAHGSAVVRPDGSVDFTPDPEWHGLDVFEYLACDPFACGVGTVSLTVSSVLDVPLAAPDGYTTSSHPTAPVKLAVDQALGLLANDTDADDDGLAVVTTPVVAPGHGVLRLERDGSFDYTPAAGFVGVDSFTYRVDDGVDGTDTATVRIRVVAPSLSLGLYLGDSGSGPDDWDLVSGPLADVTPPPDTDGDGRPGLTIARSTGDRADGDGAHYQHWSYRPTGAPLRLEGPVTLELWDAFADLDKHQDARVFVWLEDCDGGGGDCSTLSSLEYFETDWNDRDDYRAHVLNLGYVDATIAAGRQVRLRVMYDHDDFWLPLTFGQPSRLTLTLRPVAVDDVLGPLAEDSGPTPIDVLANDRENADPGTVTVLSQPVHGTVAPRPDGRIDYRPDREWHGADSFTYRVCVPGGECGVGTVSLTVSSVPDVPLAAPDGYTTSSHPTAPVKLAVDQALGLLANDTDADDDGLAVVTTPVVAPGHGVLRLERDGSFDYTPAAGFVGVDSFTYRVDDGVDGTATATVRIRVVAPSLSLGLYLGDSGSGPDDWDLVSGPLADVTPPPDTDGDGHPGLTISRSTGDPADGDGAHYQHWSYRPSGVPLRLEGPVTLELWDAFADLDKHQDARVFVWLEDCDGGGGDCSTLSSLEYFETDWNDRDDYRAHVLNLGYVDATIAAGRQVRLRVMYDHDDFWLPLTFDQPSRLTLGLSPVAYDDWATVVEDSSANPIDLLANDRPDTVPGSVTLIETGHGSAFLQPDQSIEYTPDREWNGTDTVTYRACLADGYCTEATVWVRVTPVPDDPQAEPDAYLATRDVLLSVNKGLGLLGNDSDVDDGKLEVVTTPVVAPSHGLLLLSRDGSFDYTPDLGFTGTDTFTYRMNAGGGRTDTAVVSIRVVASPNQLSLHLGDSGSGPDDWDLVTSRLANVDPPPDTDADGHPGLTVARSNGDPADTDGDRYQHWSYRPAGDLRLQGPVTLDLWDAFSDFRSDEEARLFLVLEDCNGAGTACTTLRTLDHFEANWNDKDDWKRHRLNLGHLDTTITAGRQLRLRVMYSYDDFWLPLTQHEDSVLTVTRR